MEISLNGDKLQVEVEATLADVLGDRCFANRSGTSVTVDNLTVSKSNWSATLLSAKDRIRIIATTTRGLY